MIIYLDNAPHPTTKTAKAALLNRKGDAALSYSQPWPREYAHLGAGRHELPDPEPGPVEMAAEDILTALMERLGVDRAQLEAAARE